MNVGYVVADISDNIKMYEGTHVPYSLCQPHAFTFFRAIFFIRKSDVSYVGPDKVYVFSGSSRQREDTISRILYDCDRCNGRRVSFHFHVFFFLLLFLDL